MKRKLCLFLFPYVCASGLWAQAGAGSGAVSGTVKEASTDGLPDVTVELTNPALGLRRVMTTTDDGLFTSPALTPSSGYRLKLSHKNFIDWESGDFEVTVGQTVNFQVTMKHKPEAVKYDEGTIPAPRVQQWKAGTASVVTPAQLASLPSSGRRLDPFVTLAPFASRDNPGRVVINGQARSVEFLTDGILTTNTYYENRPGIARQLSLDHTQELQVMAGNSSPEFGAALGGFVNAATRSGAETFHGSVYDYLDARDWNALGRYGTQLGRQNQFGAAAGGAIRPGKLFYFANAEVWDGSGDAANRITSQALADPFGLTVSTSNCRATAAQCAAAAAFIEGQMNVPVALSGRTATGLAKIDYRRSDRNQFTFVGNAMNGRAPAGGLDQAAPNGGLIGLPDSTEQIRYGKAGWVSAPSENSVNELRFGLFQDRISNPASQAALATGAAGVVVAGANIGNPRPNADSLREHRYQLVENMTASANTHTFKVGADVWQTSDRINGMNAAGTYFYNSLSSFAQDLTTGARNYSYFTQDFGDPYRKLLGRQYNLYAMDTWRPIQRLTIVAGVRWEKARRQQPLDMNTNYYATGKITAPVIDFAPRISAAYQYDPHTVLRFGYSWFYEPLPGQAIDALYLGNGVYETSATVNPNQAGAPAFPSVLAAAPSGATNLIYGASKLRDPRVAQYTAALERTIGKDTTLAITAVRDNGVDFWTANDVNLTAPTVTKTYVVENVAGAPVGSYATSIWTARQDARYAHIYDAMNGGTYWRSAVAVELRKRMSHGVSAQASYTWSHAMDNTGGPVVGGVFPVNENGSGVSNRADSAIDQRHRFVVNWTWQPTLTRSSSAVLRHALNGWAVSGIGTVASGMPVTPLVLVAGQQFSGTTMTYTTSLNGTGAWPRSPFDPIASLRTARRYNLDARVSRTFTFTERVKGTVLFEAFNALNSEYSLGLNSFAYQAIPTAPPAGSVNGPYSGIVRALPGLGATNAVNEARRAQVGFRVTF